MLVMRTIEDPTDPLGQLVSAQKTVGLDYLPLAVHPLRLDGVQPRALLGQQTAYDPHSLAALSDLAVVLAEPAPELFGDVPARVVPDQKQDLLTHRFELLGAPSEKLSRYTAHGPTIYKPDPRLFKLGQIKPVAGDGFRLGIVFGHRLLWMRRKGFPSSEKLLKVGRATLLHQHSSQKPTAHSEELASATLISRSRRLFFFRTGDRGR